MALVLELVVFAHQHHTNSANVARMEPLCGAIRVEIGTNAKSQYNNLRGSYSVFYIHLILK